MRLPPRAFALLLLAASATSACAADDERPRYSLKEDDAAHMGTRVRNEIARGGIIPFDRRYEELTNAQREYLKSQYESMGANDEPPFPVNGLASIYKVVAKGQQKFLVTGDMSLAVEVNGQGEATSVSIFKSPDAELTKFVASVLMFQKYKPAVCNGSPCTMQFPFRVKFEAP